MNWVRRNYGKLWVVFAILVALTVFGRLYSRPIIALLAVGFIVLLIASYRSPEQSGIGSAGDAGDLICDRCGFNYGNACGRPERPNASRCPDFAQR